MGNTIMIGGPSLSLGGFPSIGGLGFGNGLFGPSQTGFGGGNLFGNAGFGNNSSSSIPGMDGTLFKLAHDAANGNIEGVFKGLSDLFSLLGNSMGGNSSQIQPLPSPFDQQQGGGQCGLGSPAGGGSPTGCGNSSNNAQQSTEDQQTQQLLQALLSIFGPLLQAFGALLSLMGDSNSNNSLFGSSFGNSQYGSLRI
jgi:hypothetical protein